MEPYSLLILFSAMAGVWLYFWGPWREETPEEKAADPTKPQATESQEPDANGNRTPKRRR